MQIKVSKVFTNFINETAQKMGFEASAQVVEYTEQQYTNFVNIWGPNWTDYNPATGKFKVIVISYPANFFACSTYITTAELVHEFKKRNIQTFDQLREMVRDLCEI